jgi:hypothetical protein
MDICYDIGPLLWTSQTYEYQRRQQVIYLNPVLTILVTSQFWLMSRLYCDLSILGNAEVPLKSGARYPVSPFNRCAETNDPSARQEYDEAFWQDNFQIA